MCVEHHTLNTFHVCAFVQVVDNQRFVVFAKCVFGRVSVLLDVSRVSVDEPLGWLGSTVRKMMEETFVRDLLEIC